jgi:hypothetical protein
MILPSARDLKLWSITSRHAAYFRNAFLLASGVYAPPKPDARPSGRDYARSSVRSNANPA